MELAQLIKTAINPALAILPMRMDSPRARVMLLSIGLQESHFEHRRQMGNGPARGFWQFERGGGVKGVFTHSASTGHLRNLCDARGVPFDVPTIWAALERDDVLAAGVARLLLYTDPYPLPAEEDAGASWDLYLRTWRPGKPHPRTWPGYHQQAREALGLR
ncbi:hypothetical protein CY658_05120 [Variovorax sp. RO1]|uniref:hypothetical protein n=1 Tax=Variovorax sp. RO1 TaxID=2066034 RepID=UPI000C718836|nr:hypothetical protein [Variovorax sp. RO1]PLC06416.1 hypothetical protein CY658_05120 [Variovorax sp. RO1]